MSILIEGKNIYKTFGHNESRVVALNNVNIAINEGEFVTIMGPSGSGKSTLLFAISGMDEIDSGEIYFQDKNISSMKADDMADLRRKDMGFVFQEPTMLNNLDILDNIILPMYDDNKIDKEKLIHRGLELMEGVGLVGLEKRNITEVSGGQLQRASICRAILHQPKILFGDEPTGALNSKTSDEIMNLFEKLNTDGMTILIVTHDSKVAARSKRVLFMKDGKIESEEHFEKESQNERLNIINKKMLDLGI